MAFKPTLDRSGSLVLSQKTTVLPVNRVVDPQTIQIDVTSPRYPVSIVVPASLLYGDSACQRISYFQRFFHYNRDQIGTDWTRP